MRLLIPRHALVLTLWVLISSSATAQWRFAPLEPDYFNRNTYGSYGLVMLFDVSPTPIHHHEIPDDNNIPQLYKHNLVPINFLMVEREFRMNLLTYSDKGSLSFNVIPSLGLAYYEPSTKSIPYVYIFEEKGFGLFRAPIMLQWNARHLSTYNNIDRWGFHVGFGRQFNISPIIMFETDYDWGIKPSLNSIIDRNQFYWNNVIRAGVQWSNSLLGNVWVDVHVGFGPETLWRGQKLSRLNQLTLVIGIPYTHFKYRANE